MKTTRLQYAAAAAALVSSSLALSGEAWNIVNDATAWMDTFWDPALSMLFDPATASSMSHTTLGSVWYAVGLLARNGNNGCDAANADAIINYVIDGQFKDPQDLWYGDYTKESEEPAVGSSVYAPKEYGK